MVFSQKTVQPLVGKTILQIIPMLDAGGAERTTIDIAEGLAQAGARSLVATAGGRSWASCRRRAAMDPLSGRDQEPARHGAERGQTRADPEIEKVDLVHARSRAPAWVALAASRLTGTGFMTTYHGAYSGLSAPKLLYNSVMARGEVVIANSHFTAERIQTQFRIDPTRLRVIHRGTNFEAFAPDKVSSERVEKIRRGWLVAPRSAWCFSRRASRPGRARRC